ASPAQKLAAAGTLLACAAAAALVYFGFFQAFPRWWVGVKGTFGAIWDGGYAADEIRRYTAEMAGTARSLLADFLPVWLLAAVAVAGVLALRARPRWQAPVAVVAGGAILGDLAWLAFDKYLFADNWTITPFYLGVLLLFAVLAFGSRLARPQSGRATPNHPWALAAAAAFLFSLPYLGAFGTNNPIHLNCLFQIAPWVVLAAGLLAAIDDAWGSAWPSRSGLLLLASVSAGQFYEGYWIRPYRNGGPRASLVAPTPVGFPPTTLRLTEEANDFLMTGRRTLEQHGFRPGDDLLVFFNLPGFVFATGGVSPGHPWYFQGSAHNYELDLMRLNFIAPERRRRAFIVRNSAEPDWIAFQPYLRRAGLNFPEDYELISPPMVFPLTRAPFEIWMPRARPAPPAGRGAGG
ncbi:MAG TPA: hypothetical protein VG838_11880, partial [Opitutaceae bacterium]|nr:hypothetical protein [Opitutaceae bacterium]